jgi:hypothetical protein
MKMAQQQVIYIVNGGVDFQELVDGYWPAVQ